MTAAAVLALTPGHDTSPGLGANTKRRRLNLANAIPTVDQEIRERASRPDYYGWLAHTESAHGCVRPIRLRGTLNTVHALTGAVLEEFSTNDLPDGVLYKPCGTRRASLCPACARTYKADAYHVVVSGLTGGKGVPESVASHPAIFPTLTAPGFGPVHHRDETASGVRRCRPRGRRDDYCPHGVLLSCPRRHREDEACLGKPLCARCFDYQHAVVWNAHAGELWRRTALAFRRNLDRTSRQLGYGRVKPDYGKAAEYQHRGLVHFHVLARLDGYQPGNPDGLYLAPPPGLTPEHVAAAFHRAVAQTRFRTAPHPAKPEGWLIEWGRQIKTRIVWAGVDVDGKITDTKVAAYMAKYATKSTEIVGGAIPRITDRNIGQYTASRTHIARLIEAAWTLGDVPDTRQNQYYRAMRRWAHMFGFGGHFLTKSRGYSVTFGTLRAARQQHRRTQAIRAREHRYDLKTIIVINHLRPDGTGWRTRGDAKLALTAANQARHYADIEAEERACAA